LVKAQIPGVAIAVAIALLLVTVEFVMRLAAPGVRPWQLLLAQCPIAVVAMLWFGFLGPFRPVRDIAAEMLHEFLLGLTKYLHPLSGSEMRALATSVR
jgi:hypothetical protein